MPEPLDYATPERDRVVPTDLKVVAWLFIGFGIVAAVGMVVQLTQKRLNVNFSVLGIFIGWGLLRLRPYWRTWALVFCWIGIIGAGLLLAFIPFGMGVRINSKPPGGAGRLLAFLGMVVFLGLQIWQYRVLTRPAVRGLFGVR